MERTMKDWALWYAARGFPVFPCRAGQKTPMTKNGHNAATTDQASVRYWWDQWPDANIGFAVPEGFAVVDVDIKHDEGKHGDETLRGLEALHGPLPDTVRSLTGGGGVQHFFRTDATLACKNGLFDAIDLKTKGGYVILPPSLHPNGRRYEWEVDHAPGEIDGATLPQWIVDARLSTQGKASDMTPAREDGKIPEGQRNQTLHKLASSMRSKGFAEESILAALLADNKARCVPPLDESEVRKIAHSAGKYEQGMVHTAASDFAGLQIYQANELPPPEPQEAKPPVLAITSAKDLMSTVFSPLIQAVDMLVCEGLTMLVSASKIGKSWLVLLMAFRVAKSEPFLGRRTTKCRVLYYALEDSERRLQQRMRTMGLTDVPDNLFFVTKAQMLEAGFETQLEGWLAAEEGPALVIIDTLQKVRGITKGGVNAYQNDYEVVGKLKTLADKYRAMFVLVHHTNKAKFVADPFEKISGSTGIMGAADTAIIIERERGADTATVKFEGRDAHGSDFVIRFEENCVWTLVSNDANEYKAGCDYDSDPLVQLFRKLITENPDGGRWTYTKLQALGREFLGFQPFIDGKDCAMKLNDGLADEMRRRDNILVECGVQTTGGRGIRLQQVSKIVAFPTKMPIDDE